MTDTSPGRHRPPRRHAASLPAAVAAALMLTACAGTGGGAAPSSATGSTHPAAAASPTRCFYNRPASITRDACEPAVPEGPPRKALTNAEVASATDARLAAQDAVAAAVACPPGACTTDPAELSAVIRAALTKAGFPDSTVRPARTDDAAPAGSAFYATPAGPACIIGYYRPTAEHRLHIAGPLTRGGCATP